MNDAQIKHMVDRFLGWRLPEPFRPDAGISYKRPEGMPDSWPTPTGTNLFDATQADAMVRYMIEGLPDRPAMDEARLREIALQIAREDWSHGWWPTEEEIERGDINDKAWIRGSVIPNNEKQLAEDAEKLLPIIRRAVSVYGGS